MLGSPGNDTASPCHGDFVWSVVVISRSMFYQSAIQWGASICTTTVNTISIMVKSMWVSLTLSGYYYLCLRVVLLSSSKMHSIVALFILGNRNLISLVNSIVAWLSCPGLTGADLIFNKVYFFISILTFLYSFLWLFCMPLPIHSLDGFMMKIQHVGSSAFSRIYGIFLKQNLCQNHT